MVGNALQMVVREEASETVLFVKIGCLKGLLPPHDESLKRLKQKRFRHISLLVERVSLLQNVPSINRLLTSSLYIAFKITVILQPHI